MVIGASPPMEAFTETEGCDQCSLVQDNVSLVSDYGMFYLIHSNTMIKCDKVISTAQSGSLININ